MGLLRRRRKWFCGGVVVVVVVVVGLRKGASNLPVSPILGLILLEGPTPSRVIFTKDNTRTLPDRENRCVS